MKPKKPTLAMAKALFKRRNAGIKFKAEWQLKPRFNEGWDGKTPSWTSQVTFSSEGHKPVTMRLYSDRTGLTLF
jgi:hypothetical protein